MLERKSKPKKCKWCQKTFTPYNSLMVVCSPMCASSLAAKKEGEKRARADKVKFKDMRIRAKETDHKKELQREINKLARSIDNFYGFVTCIDCDRKFGKQIDGAHFNSVGAHPSVRFNLHNIHAADSQCNKFSDQHKEGYVKGLRYRYGDVYLKRIQDLPKRFPETKLSPQEIYDKLAIVRNINRNFPNGMSFSSAIAARDWYNYEIGIFPDPI